MLFTFIGILIPSYNSESVILENGSQIRMAFRSHHELINERDSKETMKMIYLQVILGNY